MAQVRATILGRRDWVRRRTIHEYRVQFRFTGIIDKLSYKLGPEQLSAEDKEAAAKILAAARD
jgi:hypothetical protein